jgi:hypothetical protein
LAVRAMAELDQDALCRHWVHSYEDDTAGAKVFRPADYDFPPSRGRFGFQLNRDGTMVRYGIGSTDRQRRDSGTWRLENEVLVLLPGAGAAQQRLKVITVDGERLVTCPV